MTFGRFFFLLALTSLMAALPARAEYRVFLLKIETLPAAPKTGAGAPDSAAEPPPAPRIFPSNLDPEQYRGYFPLGENETIVYIDTWRCTGRTNGKEYCPSPRAPATADEATP